MLIKMKQPCPKCQSQNTYSDGPEMACLMCGKRWPINGQKPITIDQVTGRERMAQKEKSPSGKKGTCSNCGREKFIADKNGYCGICHTAVKGMDPGSVAYVAALDAIKDRINAPGFKTRPAKQKNVDRKPATIKLSPKEIKEARTPARALTIKHDGVDSGTVKIVSTLQIERENLLAQVRRIDQAISLFS